MIPAASLFRGCFRLQGPDRRVREEVAPAFLGDRPEPHPGFRIYPGPLAVLLLAQLSAEVVINEVHYAPADETRAEEFIELHNSGSTPVNLSGWELAGAVDYEFPFRSIPAGGYLVIGEDPATGGAVAALTGAIMRFDAPASATGEYSVIWST